MQRFFPEMKERERDLCLVGRRTGMTLLEISERLNNSRAHLTRYEREQMNADLAELKRSIN